MSRHTLRSCLIAGIVLVLSLPAGAAEPAAFRSARAIWPKGRETEMNLLAGFRVVFEAPADARRTVLRVTAASVYRARVNGEFVGFGPARAPHGMFRIDEWDITQRLTPGKNLVAIEVVGYNCNSFYLVDQPAFCQAEVVADERVVASTAGQGAPFVAAVPDYRVQKAERMNKMRTFMEIYALKPGWDAWFRDPGAAWPGVETAVQAGKRYLPRGVLYPEFTLRRPVRIADSGRLERQQVNIPKKDIATVGPALKGWPEAELPEIVSREVRHWVLMPQRLSHAADVKSPVVLAARQYVTVDFGGNYAGFLGATVHCTSPTRLVMRYDAEPVFSVPFALQPGEYRIETIEPYAVKQLTLMCWEGQCTVSDIHVREYAHPEARQATFACSNPQLNALYRDGVLMLRQNALDLFTDCATRERAGYPRDSLDTARVTHDLTGATLVERNFLENYVLPERFAHLPEGMLPMCYPADTYKELFIPNLALWLVTQLEDYLDRSGDRALIDAYRPKVLGLLAYFQSLENSDGLLEKLLSWVLIDFSRTGEFTQDVNYPSNMHYAAVLDTVARLYGLPELGTKAARLRETIRRQSFDGEYFVDNAVRRDGTLQVTRNRTETCQYFAFYFKVADRQTHAGLWSKLRDEFGPSRDSAKAYPEIWRSSGFVGNPIRLELLSQADCGQRILDEIQHPKVFDDFPTWAAYTSIFVHILYRDVLGLRRVDRLGRQIDVRFLDIDLDHCQGTVPTPDGPVSLRWTRHADRIEYSLIHPAGYRVTVQNLTARKLVRQA